MIIYPLPAKELDDKTLSCQIKNIAQILCDIHHRIFLNKSDRISMDSVPLQAHWFANDYVAYGITCSANYDYLVKLGLECCEEWIFRNNERETYILQTDGTERIVIMQGLTIKKHKLQHVVEWAESNKPDLRLSWDNNGLNNDQIHSPFPLCIPKEYYHGYIPFDDKQHCTKHFKCFAKRVFKPLVQIDIKQSYRNYYRAKLARGLKHKVRCKNCVAGEKTINLKLGCNCNDDLTINKPIIPTWSRREKPEYLK